MIVTMNDKVVLTVFKNQLNESYHSKLSERHFTSLCCFTVLKKSDEFNACIWPVTIKLYHTNKPRRCSKISGLVGKITSYIMHLALLALSVSALLQCLLSKCRLTTYGSIYGFYGAYSCYGLVRQVSGFIAVRVSA